MVILATINESLTQYASLNPTQKTHTQSTESLCKEIEKGNLVLPVYQTGLRWTKQKNVELYNFMLRGKAPVAPISMNVIADEDKAIDQVSFVHRNVIEGSLIGKRSVTDGQQRLTCLYKAYTNDPEFEDIVFDVSRAKFQILNAAIKKYQIPVGILLNKNDSLFYEYMNNNTFLKKDITKDAVLSVRKKFFGYNFVINLAEDLDESEQVNWFEVLNNAGSQVSLLQMKFAKMLVQGLDIYSEYTDIFRKKITDAGFEDLFPKKETEVSIPIAALNPAYEILTEQPIHTLNFSPIPSDTKEVRLTQLAPNQLREMINLTLHSLDKSLAFIKNEGLKKPTRMDYVTYLLGVFVYNNNSDLNEEQKANIFEWYNTVSFTNMSNSQRRKNFDSLLNDVVFNLSLVSQ